MAAIGFLTGVAAVFAVVGFLELFDRTSFALIALASRAHGFATWAGGSTGFLVVTAIAVSIGSVLTSALGPSRLGWLRVAGGAFLLAYALYVALRPASEGPAPRLGDRRSSFVAALGTILALELADTTMIFEVVFVATWGWLIVLIGGSAALVTVAAWNVFLGRQLGTRVSPERLDKIVIVVLVVVGVVTIAYGLFPSAFPTF